MITGRTAVSKKDLSATLKVAMDAGLIVRSTRVFSDGGFAVDYGDTEVTPSPDDLDMELIRLEARYSAG